MDDRYPTRAWPLRTVVAGQLLGWLRLRTHRLAVSSVASIRSSIDAPCVLARLGSRLPEHHAGYRSTIKAPCASPTASGPRSSLPGRAASLRPPTTPPGRALERRSMSPGASSRHAVRDLGGGGRAQQR